VSEPCSSAACELRRVCCIASPLHRIASRESQRPWPMRWCPRRCWRWPWPWCWAFSPSCSSLFPIARPAPPPSRPLLLLLQPPPPPLRRSLADPLPTPSSALWPPTRFLLSLPLFSSHFRVFHHPSLVIAWLFLCRRILIGTITSSSTLSKVTAMLSRISPSLPTVEA
jgi:hypothetical protein